MITFLDGPAAGVKLSLQRPPILLRVVRDPKTGEWDAIDQLGDRPRAGEEITVYRRRDDLLVIRASRLACVYVATASYNVNPIQPTDAQVRNTAAWREWAEAHASPPQSTEG